MKTVDSRRMTEIGRVVLLIMLLSLLTLVELERRMTEEGRRMREEFLRLSRGWCGLVFIQMPGFSSGRLFMKLFRREFLRCFNGKANVFYGDFDFTNSGR